MNKRILCSLCLVLLITGSFTACKRVGVDRDLAARLDSAMQSVSTTQQETQDSLTGTYWKTVGFDGIEIETGDFWSDLFLWEDGTGCFRFSQATPASSFYGIHDVLECGWSLEENGSLTLYEPGTKAVVYAGTVADGALTIRYDGYTEEFIEMEQAPMPPYGSHWSIPSLYGTWRMISYADAASGSHPTAYYTLGDTDGFFASEITLNQVTGVHFWLAEPLGGNIMLERGMGIGYRDDHDDTWQPYAQGPIWEGCMNEAWHVQLTGNSDPNVRFYATYADGKLLLKKEDARNLDTYPSSFTAEFAYEGYPDDGGDGDALYTRYAEKAYAAILHPYWSALQHDGEPDEMAELLVSGIAFDAHIDDETVRRELYYSIEEPLRSNSSLGYAIRDINEDGIPELFILSKDQYSDGMINALYTLQDNSAALVGAYWSRSRCALGVDGTIYLDGSSGAGDSFSAAYSLDRNTGRLKLIEMLDSSDFPDISAEEAGLSFIPFTATRTNGTSNGGASWSDSTEVYSFADIVGYDGRVYSLYAAPEIPNFMGISGSAKLSPLPISIGEKMESEGLYLYRFTIYEEKIYYLAAEAGSNTTPGAIYRCNFDGSQNQRLANDANNGSECMIMDGVLYYRAWTEESDTIYGMDLHGSKREQYVDFPVYTEPGIHTCDGFIYYFYEGVLCKKELRTERISEIMTLTSDSTNTYGEGTVAAVVNDTVYYVTFGEYGENGNTYLFGISIHGGVSELLATWYTA